MKMKRLSFLLCAFSPLLFSCEKEPKIITETIFKTDTLYVTQYDTVVQVVTDTLTLTQFIRDTATTFIVLRHAETTGIGSDPALSADGQERANELVRVLKNVVIGAVFSSNYNRTRQTAQSAAADQGLNVEIYDPLNQNPLINTVLSNHKGGAVLVVGHSNTAPALLNLLTGTNAYPQLPESQYDNLFIVTVFEKGRAEVVHLKYGKPTP